MSRSEKAKAGGKPVKLPPSVFSNWKSVINNYTESDPEVELAPVVTALVRLVDCADDPWEQQAVYIKKATQALNDKKNAVYKEQIIRVVEPIASSGYFAAAENLSRRHFIPLVEASSKQTNETSFAQLYKQYISLGAQQEPSLAQRALTISATLEFGYGKQIVLNAYHETLVYLVTSLEQSIQQLDRASLADRMNDILYLIKTLHILLSRHTAQAQPIFVKIQDPQQNDPDAQLVAKLLNILLTICTETDVYVRDCSQVAGMTIAAIVNMATDVNFARDLVLEWFFTTKEKRNILGVAPKPTLTGESGWTDRDVPMLSIVKGLVSIRADVLLSKCPDNLEYIPTLKSFQPMKNLHEVLFFSIVYFCSKADLQSASKVAAFESMSTWLIQCKSIMQSCGGDDLTMEAVSTVFQPQTVDRLVHYVWDHWDDPVDVIQHKVKAIFEITLDAVEMKAIHFEENEEYQLFLRKLLTNLIDMDWHRKVKYALLNILVPKLGTDVFLQAEPNIIWKCFRAMDSLILSPQITALVMALLNRRITETIPGYENIKGQNMKLVEKPETKVPIQQWVDLWSVPLLRVLTSSSELLRKNISNFIMQPLFRICPQSFWTLMEKLQTDSDALINKELRLHAFIALLKVGRSLDIVSADAYTLEKSSANAREISVDTLRVAIYHLDPQVRLDVLGLMCESRKAITPITKTELEILQEFIPLNMNCTSPEFRQTFCTHISRLLYRLRGIFYAQYRSYKSCTAYLHRLGSKVDPDDKKYVNARAEANEALDSMENGKQFLYWLIKYIQTSLYPGASYQRVATALRLLSTLIKIFGVTELPVPVGFGDQPDFPFQVPVGTPQLTKILIDTLMNPFDFNRVQAFDILSQFPNPLPGIEARQDAQHLLWWGLDNVVSTRAGESDSGAMVFRLIFTKYVKELGYDLYPERDVKEKVAPAVDMAPVVFTERLLDLLNKQVEAAKSNLLLAAQQHPMHGTLLALQYIFRELDYHHPSVRAKLKEWKKTHNRALAMVHSVCTAVMDVLSNPSPEGNVPSSYREMEEAIDDLIDDGDDDGAEDSSSGPKHQVILSCCWRAVKEASALLEVIISRAPVSRDRPGLITAVDLKESGVLLRTLLTSVRHRGAFSAVYPAYVSLNMRLLDSADANTADLPAQWLEDNLASITSNNISVTRRSAGLPLCILAIVSSERSSKKKMLDQTMRRLLELANQEPPPDADQRIDMPQVHAYNILRTIFMDAKLATAVLGYASDGFSLAISGFSSSSWAIRNCAVMLFSTLLQRTFGTKKTRDEHSAVNKLTGREFFTRYPQLHPYLLEQLEIAVDQLLAKSTATSTVHPGLYPILTLLSRLHPSVMDGASQVTAMAPFVPLVTSCAVSAIFKTREMAARALVPLISSSDLAQTVLMLLDVPQESTQNEIHGRLLQVQFLLRGHLYHPGLRDHLFDFVKRIPAAMLATVLCANMLSRVTYALLLDIISEFFFDCSWISTDRDQGLIQELNVAAEENFELLRRAVLDQCRQGIAEEVVPQQVVIGGFLARRSMAQILVQDALEKQSISDILYLLDDIDYEVRLTCMTLLEKHSNSEMEGINALQEHLLIKTYKGESNLNCFVLAAKFLLALKIDFDRVHFTRIEYWNRLVEQFVSSRSQAVTESVLPLLGSLLAQIMDDCGTEKDWLNQCIILWSKYVVANSSKEITLPLREAAVESIRSMAMHIFENEETARVQLTVTQLLQDDDIDIRTSVAEIVSKALRLPAPVHPERATELVYMNLSKSLHHLEELSSSLVSGLLGEENLRK
ncbi:putative death-receptor fusion protein-domain-containing protein [Zychaea mexicana]|uniref:putative death-receptor fusion protein-domain-containing protein n=1 Tax=Zychaea mexicana TaxID=64656 RepID=UPI0022FE02D6|nr:putative death-receptor fusion protein-domain-containing protein [Zychaea mexicana]KAI9479552.1 putative death-receptor fusion protein-domain-containing protein [Zychaea mexicana]